MGIEDLKEALNPLSKVKMSDKQEQAMMYALRKRMADHLTKPPRRSRRQNWRLIPVAMGCAVLILAATSLHGNINNQRTPVTNAIVVDPNSPTSHSVALSFIHMLDEKTGWGVDTSTTSTSGPIVYRTTDGGLNWTEVGLKIPSLIHKDLGHVKESAFAFPTANQGILAIGVPRGTPGSDAHSTDVYVVSTKDGGRTWSTFKIQDDTQPNMYDQTPIQMTFINPSVGWMTTRAGDSGGVNNVRSALYQTNDGGITWKQVSVTRAKGSLPPANGFPSDGWVSFINETVGFTIGQGPTQTDLLSSSDITLYRTMDSGRTWVKVAVDFPSISDPKLGGYTVVPPQKVGNMVYLPVLVENRSANKTTQTLYVYRSGDDGNHFSPMGHLALGRFDSSLEFGFWTELRGWFWHNGELIETDDGGETLKRIGKMKVLPDIYTTFSWVDKSTAWVTDGMDLWITRDGGVTWKRAIDSQ